MATLTSEQLSANRRGAEPRMAAIDYDKPIINAAFQAIEDWFDANKASGSAAIDAATTPFGGYTFSNPEKKLLVALWMKQKWGREL